MFPSLFFFFWHFGVSISFSVVNMYYTVSFVIPCINRSLGQIENARIHIYIPGHQPDPTEVQKLQSIEKHINKCADARRVGDWRSTLREVDAAIASGADASPEVCL